RCATPRASSRGPTAPPRASVSSARHSTRRCASWASSVLPSDSMTTDDPSESDSPTTRLEAFSDGVFAIAITLLVLEIRLPPAAEIEHGGGLAYALLALWPSYAG